MTLEDRIRELREQKAALIAYLKSKIAAEDWHAVADAAMDLREAEVALRMLNA